MINRRLSPKARRNIARIIPFGVIWLVISWIFYLVEIAAMGTRDPGSETVITMTFPIVIFSSIASMAAGMLVGAIEMIWLENLFATHRFIRKILYKLGLYTVIMLVLVLITYPIAASLEIGTSIIDSRVWEKFVNYMVSVTLLSTLLQLTFSLLLCLLYAGISENLGHGVLANFFLGKYHTPTEERRIFMFLDMKSSTTVAEQLGHIRYFDLLRAYYSDLANAIIDHEGEVYQYVGDEIVITWTAPAGLAHNNCVNCFFAMKADLANRAPYYEEQFEVVPTFKAGLHIGDVTTGEIGALKKEIIFTGDVLNATARIQGLCNQYQTDLLVSGPLIAELALSDDIEVKSLGQAELKGKTQQMELYSLRSPKTPKG